MEWTLFLLLFLLLLLLLDDDNTIDEDNAAAASEGALGGGVQTGAVLFMEFFWPRIPVLLIFKPLLWLPFVILEEVICISPSSRLLLLILLLLLLVLLLFDEVGGMNFLVAVLVEAAISPSSTEL